MVHLNCVEVRKSFSMISGQCFELSVKLVS